ncbi:MAG: YfcE family phosphodiesterase [Candidatus Cloacimonetes bacterium]|nr:YfcE family phosphodiesterase [Candidatus Cloacimonadota bacterium]MCF7813571.1 YfcE family phosphodiesterase [Candidatus Cloacimonadota bacterium]MCF7868202.1 YfcE family phosphodiesterase [Candidatus Cloacimonadota bacterium]MCF7883634.1 YfcE family phosphodiesterase [Candidatus Cloacimonadota bacterium]
MKRIMIMSDTHRNQVLLRKAFLDEENITHIFHLGDTYEDLDENLDLIEGIEVFKVPGLYHDGYLNRSIHHSIPATVENWKFQLVHFLNDVKKLHKNLDFVLYGHTHRPNFRELNGMYFINPGHLKRSRDRGNDASYIIAETETDKITFNWKKLNKEIFMTKTISR